MPMQHAIRRVGHQRTLLASSKLVSDKQLEDVIVSACAIRVTFLVN